MQHSSSAEYTALVNRLRPTVRLTAYDRLVSRLRRPSLASRLRQAAAILFV
jgi:hypothetical protein